MPPLKSTIPSRRKETIAIVDSQPSSRIGLSHFIKKINRWEIAWFSATAEEAMKKISTDQPDMMIMEIQLTGKDGLELIKHLLPLYPQLKILVHSSHSEEFYAERCLRAGALGYLHKMDPMVNFENAVEKVLLGELYVNPRLAIRLKIGLECAAQLHAYSVRFYGENALMQKWDDSEKMPERVTKTKASKVSSVPVSEKLRKR